jgi:uncharacterized protein
MNNQMNNLLSNPIFHLSMTVDSLETARAFYCETIGCIAGRSAATWIDIDFFGHQLSLHLGPIKAANTGQVERLSVPIPHYGVVLNLADWNALIERLRGASVQFMIEPQVRFEGAPEEQGTFFIADPAGNALEFKGASHAATLLEAHA